MDLFQATLHAEPVTWNKLVAQCKWYHGDTEHLCGITLWKGLPLLVTEMICKCEKNYFERVGSTSAKGGSLGTYCLDCGKPSINSISRNHYKCEVCNKYFCYDYRSIDRIPKQKICEACDVPVATSGRSTTGFRFN